MARNGNASVSNILRGLVLSSKNRPISRRNAGAKTGPVVIRTNSNGGARVRGVLRAAKGNGLDLVTDLQYGFMNYFNNPKTVITLLVVLALAYSHTLDNTDNALTNFAGRYPNNKLLGLIVTNLVKAIGCVAFLPTFVAMPKRSMPVLVMLGVVLCIVCLPEANFYQYLGLAMILHMYCHARVSSSRVAMLLVFAVYVLVLHEMMRKLPPLSQLLTEHSVRSTVTLKP